MKVRKIKIDECLSHSGLLLVSPVVNEGKGRLSKRKDGKFLIYVPVGLAEDSMFPFQTNSAVPVKISFELGDDKLKIEKWNEENE